MTIRPHDTEQILDTLSEAVELLRSPTPVNRGMIANDLALLHGAVEAEAKKADETLGKLVDGFLPQGATPKPIDVKPSPGHTARYLGGTVTGDDARIRFARADKRERIADEEARGEHRDDER